jgi:hypothetical protein
VRLQKTCQHCGKEYLVERHRFEKSRFCSNSCVNQSNRTAERREITCEACSTKFITTHDHGEWPRFCSRKCFLDVCNRPKEKPCAHCGAVFLARSDIRTDDGYDKYCSKTCSSESKKSGDERTCLNCGNTFYLSQSKMKQRNDEGCCSQECRKEYYQGERSRGFKGGAYVAGQSGNKMVLAKRPGYIGKYMGEHRLVASKSIGRLVTRQEYVIRINRNPDDNRPENLFICASISEFSKRRNGSLPWPTKSNLKDYDLSKKTPPKIGEQD